MFPGVEERSRMLKWKRGRLGGRSTVDVREGLPPLQEETEPPAEAGRVPCCGVRNHTQGLWGWSKLGVFGDLKMQHDWSLVTEKSDLS